MSALMARNMGRCSSVIVVAGSSLINVFKPFLKRRLSTSAPFGDISGYVLCGHLLTVQCNYLCFPSMKRLNFSYPGNKETNKWRD